MAQSPGCILYLHPVVKRAMVVSKVFGADRFHLPKGYGQKFPVSCLSRQGLAIHWSVKLFCAFILSSAVSHESGQYYDYRSLMPLLDYANAIDYVRDSLLLIDAVNLWLQFDCSSACCWQ